VSSSNNTGNPGLNAIPTASTVTLGATVTTSGSTGIAIVVPYDGTNDGKANGIALNATVIIGGHQGTVNTIVENPATGLTTITLFALLDSSYVPGAGVLVAEQKTIQTTVTAGTIITTGTDVTVSDTMTATSGSGSGPAFTSGSVLNTYTSGIATLAKYVRNVSTNVAGTGTPYIYGGFNYYLAGVTAKAVPPTPDTLEYLLIATNISTTGTVPAAVVTDAIPTSYVTLKTGVYTGGKDITYIDETPTVHYLTVNAVGSAATYAAPTLTVNVGGATPATPPAAGGTIPATKSVVVLYQVTLNP
jgi:hypothetical protein